MHVMRLISGAALAAAVVVAPTAPALAAPATTTEADLIGVVNYDRSNPDVGYVKARYRCSGEGALWISVKQTADRTADPILTQEGSSRHAAAWLDSHRNPVTCNGQWQTQTFVVDQLEPVWGGGQKPGELAKGDAYVQFCLFDDTTTAGPLSENEFMHVRGS